MSEARDKKVDYKLKVQNATTCQQSEVFRSVPKITDRIYALMRLKELHKKMEESADELERRIYRKEAIYLSMKWVGVLTCVTVLICIHMWL